MKRAPREHLHPLGLYKYDIAFDSTKTSPGSTFGCRIAAEVGLASSRKIVVQALSAEPHLFFLQFTQASATRAKAFIASGRDVHVAVIGTEDGGSTAGKEGVLLPRTVAVSSHLSLIYSCTSLSTLKPTASCMQVQCLL